jgi:hypothetical protein
MKSVMTKIFFKIMVEFKVSKVIMARQERLFNLQDVAVQINFGILFLTEKT